MVVAWFILTRILITVEPFHNGHLELGAEESGRCREVAFSGCSTVLVSVVTILKIVKAFLSIEIYCLIQKSH